MLQPFPPAGSHILAGEGGQCRRGSIDKRHDKGLDADGRIVPGNHIRSMHIYRALDQQPSEIQHRLLQRRRPAEHHRILQDPFFKNPLSFPQPQHGNPFSHIEDTEHKGNRLRKHCGQRGCRHSQRCSRNQRNVQDNIQHRGKHQIEEGGSGIPYGTQGGGVIIVEKRKNHSPKHNLQILPGRLQNFPGSLGSPKHQAGQGNTDGGHRQGKHNPADQARGKLYPELVPLAGTVLLRQQHAHSHGQPHQKKQHHRHDGIGHTYRRERIFSDKPSHDNGVGGVIQLLKNIPQDNRD